LKIKLLRNKTQRDQRIRESRLRKEKIKMNLMKNSRFIKKKGDELINKKGLNDI
jgi:hypothetical protein